MSNLYPPAASAEASPSPGGEPFAPPTWWSIVSGKGGVGKTSLAVNLSIALAEAGARTLLVDGDLALANADVLLGMAPAPSIESALLGEEPLLPHLLQGPHGLELLPGAAGSQLLAAVGRGRIRDLMSSVAGYARHHDIVLLDSPPGVGISVLELVRTSHRTCLVLTPDPPAFTDAYALLKLIQRDAPESWVGLFVNRCRDGAEARDVVERFWRASERFLHCRPPWIGWLPEDAAVGRAVRTQDTFVLASPAAPASRHVRALATDILHGSWERSPEPDLADNPEETI